VWGYKPGKRERVICRLGYVRAGVMVGVGVDILWLLGLGVRTAHGNFVNE